MTGRFEELGLGFVVAGALSAGAVFATAYTAC